MSNNRGPPPPPSLALFRFPPRRGERAAGADAGEDQTLFVQRQVEEAKDDAVDQEVELGSAARLARIRR